jgi:zinc transport system permease protein
MEMFEYTFMINALIAGIIIAVLASTFGIFVVVKRYAMLSDTLAHVSLLGVAIGFLLNISTIWSAIIVALSVSLIIEYIRNYKTVYSDSILAIFLSSSLALAIIIVSLSNAFNSSLFDYLFGSIVAVSHEDIISILVFATVSLFLIGYHYQKLLLISFDEDLAYTSGINVRFLNLLFVSLVAIMIGLAIKIIGALLIGALMIIPISTAILFKQGFFTTWMIALSMAVFSVVVGLTLSFYIALPSGATIVLLTLILFCLSYIYKKFI